jgi:hypothetical protein
LHNAAEVRVEAAPTEAAVEDFTAEAEAVAADFMAEAAVAGLA